MAAPADDDSDAAVDPECEDSYSATECAENQYVALAVQPAARGTLPVDDDGEVDDAASNSISSSSTIALQQHRLTLQPGPPEFRRHNQHKNRKLFEAREPHNWLAMPGVFRRHWIFFARCHYCRVLSKYVQRTACDFHTKQVAGVPPHSVPSFLGHCGECRSQQELSFYKYLHHA